MDSKEREQSLSVQAPGQTHSVLDSRGLFDFVFTYLLIYFHFITKAMKKWMLHFSPPVLGGKKKYKKTLHREGVHRLPDSALFGVFKHSHNPLMSLSLQTPPLWE